MANEYNSKDELYHFGVKGMKWGVRRARSKAFIANRKALKEANKVDKYLNKANSQEKKFQKHGFENPRGIYNLERATDNYSRAKKHLYLSMSKTNEMKLYDLKAEALASAKNSKKYIEGKKAMTELEASVNVLKREAHYQDVASGDYQRRMAFLFGPIAVIGSATGPKEGYQRRDKTRNEIIENYNRIGK